MAKECFSTEVMKKSHKPSIPSQDSFLEHAASLRHTIVVVNSFGLIKV